MDSIAFANLPSEKEFDKQNKQLLQLKNCIKDLNEADKAVITLYLEELPYKTDIGNLGPNGKHDCR